ncbi:hypothetical protein ACFSR7_35985 [Cohnella sp. GCM10020058]
MSKRTLNEDLQEFDQRLMILGTEVARGLRLDKMAGWMHRQLTKLLG